jgi:hypothetical protein
VKGVGASLPLRFGAAVFVLGGAALTFLGGGARTAAVAMLPPPLELDGPGCTVSVEDAAARARSAELAAVARMARYPFDTGEGVEAARLLHEAARCARTARDDVAAARIQALEGRWIARLGADYRVRTIRVRVALDRETPAIALSEVTELGRLLQRSTGEYVKWLEREKRRLERGGDRE